LQKSIISYVDDVDWSVAFIISGCAYIAGNWYHN